MAKLQQNSKRKPNLKSVCGSKSMEKAIDFCFRTEGAAGSVAPTIDSISRPSIKQSGMDHCELVIERDGTELRLCADAKHRAGTAKLYCSYDGHFYSLSRNGLNEVLPAFGPSQRACTRGSKHYVAAGSRYPTMRDFGCKTCHTLICTAWHGPRPTFIDEHGNEKPMECDHLNANPYDYHADNLEWVTPAENRRRAKILRGLRSAGIVPEKAYTYAQLKDIFNTYDIQNN